MIPCPLRLYLSDALRGPAHSGIQPGRSGLSADAPSGRLFICPTQRSRGQQRRFVSAGHVKGSCSACGRSMVAHPRDDGGSISEHVCERFFGRHARRRRDRGLLKRAPIGPADRAIGGLWVIQPPAYPIGFSMPAAARHRPRAADPLPRSTAGGIVGIMPTRRSVQTPDLFSAPPTAKAPEPLAVPQSKAHAGSSLARNRAFFAQGPSRSAEAAG
jgi:hypothetical protein